MAKRGKSPAGEVKVFEHKESTVLMRPDVGTQAQFRKKKKPETYRYDSSLSPSLEWDREGARERGESLMARIANAQTRTALLAGDESDEAQRELRRALEEAQRATSELKAMSRPFLNWSGKAERLSFDVPTLPLFVHERLSTKAIIQTLKGHKRDRQEALFDLFSDPRHSVTDQVLRAYEYPDPWVNRMILGDSLIVMNSLLHYEGLGGQVQMIYIDPPYGVKFGSNFQPFVRKRDVSHNEDEDMTREPEMVQAYRDTWELGLHSYLTYLRDRLLLARDLLKPEGSVFVQISDENLHHVRELMDEVLGAENFAAVIPFAKTSGQTPVLLSSVADYLLWYARDKKSTKFRPLFVPKNQIEDVHERYVCVQTHDGEVIDLTVNQKVGSQAIPTGRILRLRDLSSQTGTEASRFEYEYLGKRFSPPRQRGWSTTRNGLDALLSVDRLYAVGNSLRWKNYHEDFAYRAFTNLWSETVSSGFGEQRLYVVQTPTEAIQRCVLMTTDPGDLILDPTCGSGTTAYVAEQWRRRWITIDTSRVPLALARQRLLTATFSWYELQDEKRGPSAGFVYKRKQNTKGEEIGGIVPHITLKSIANNEPPAEEVLVDRPEQVKSITRVSGPFCFEATIPTPVDWEGDGVEDSRVGASDAQLTFTDRMLEILRKSPVLHLDENRTLKLRNVRPPARTLTLSAEASALNGDEKTVAFVFGPENGAVSEKLVYEAAREAHLKSYAHLYVLGFAIEANARLLVEHCKDAVGIPATYVQMTPDLQMGDLLKTMRSSQIFSVCGLPEVEVRSLAKEKGRIEVQLIGLDTFDPISMEVRHQKGDDVPAWFLDTDYNGLSFHVSQAFFPRTEAWDNLRKALKGEFEESVWAHLAGDTSAPFEPGDNRRIAVKVIDDRGNELLVERVLD